MKLQTVCCLIAGLWLSGCADETARTASTPQDSSVEPELKTYLVLGTIREIDAAGKTVTIEHEEIPGFMDAMTMPFNVKDTRQLEGVQPNDAVKFRLNVSGTESWIDKLGKLPVPVAADASEEPETTPDEAPPLQLVKSAGPLAVGDAIPNYRFTNQLGKVVRFGDYKGQALALTFIYTRCPLPDFCPRMMKNFGDVQRILASTPDAPMNWHLFSISFDPTNDTPEVLKAYGETYGYDAEKWSLVTGSFADLVVLTDQLNLSISDDGAGLLNHRLRTVLVDPTGRVQDIIIGNSWTPQEVADEIIKAAKNSGPSKN